MSVTFGFQTETFVKSPFLSISALSLEFFDAAGQWLNALQALQIRSPARLGWPSSACHQCTWRYAKPLSERCREVRWLVTTGIRCLRHIDVAALEKKVRVLKAAVFHVSVDGRTE